MRTRLLKKLFLTVFACKWTQLLMDTFYVYLKMILAIVAFLALITGVELQVDVFMDFFNMLF